MGSILSDFAALYLILSSKKVLTFKKNISIMKSNGSRNTVVFLEVKEQGSRAPIQIWIAAFLIGLGTHGLERPKGDQRGPLTGLLIPLGAFYFQLSVSSQIDCVVVRFTKGGPP